MDKDSKVRETKKIETESKLVGKNRIIHPMQVEKTSSQNVVRQRDILVRGARVNNLKNVDVELPRNKFIVITGLSGSGKSSLAFDTLYAEGQRRYVESLSSYARQFLGRMSKPDCDSISGLPPAIAIEQKVNTRNPRSTVGTSTEIYDYMRLLFARIGHTISPVSFREVKREGIEDVLAQISTLESGTRIAITAPVMLPDKRSFAMQLEVYLKAGYSRLYHYGEFVDIEDMMNIGEIPESADGYSLLIDRTIVSDDKEEISRVAESIEAAFFEGHGELDLVIFGADEPRVIRYNTRFEADGMSFVEPTDAMFNFNNPYGACPRCEGFGRTIGIDERLVVPNPDLSLFEDCVMCWRGEKMSEYKREFIRLAVPNGFPIHRSYRDLTPEQRDMLWNGVDGVGINSFFEWISSQQHKIQYRVMLARYRGKTICPECHGTRLRRDASYVKIGSRSITELVIMSVADLLNWFEALQLDERETAIAARLIVEIKNRLSFLVNVGLGYLTLDRLSNTLSGGESQRINLATSLGSSLVGSMYILDEPSIGLHPRDNDRLIDVLRRLQRLGNTVVVVEHDEEIMRRADYIIDVGPAAGRLGGEVIYQGSIDRLCKAKRSYTRKYLEGELSIPLPQIHRRSSSYIEVKGAAEHNLKNVDVRFPLGLMTVVTGVSGSGKSTLVRDVLYKSLARHLGEAVETPGLHSGIGGDLNRIQAVEFVDQNPIGRSTRSNPATYLKAYDAIRQLYAAQPLSQQMGFTAGHFSFNAEGGRCEECKGEGTITIEMQFMADITVECEACHGRRFKSEILEVEYRKKNITDILDMTVDEAIEFFSQSKGNDEKRIVSRLQPLHDVGLGYIKLGQSSSTLSGGENQRVKLAYFLSLEKPVHTLFIFDEPTTGLHFHDINTLMDSFDRLISRGHTIVIIEHNLDVIKCADNIVDIGPEAGDAGGHIVVTGTPEQVAACAESVTGRYLSTKLFS